MLSATETCTREDVSFSEETEDLATTSAFYYILRWIGERPDALAEQIFCSEDPTATPIRHQFADHLVSELTLDTTVTHRGPDALRLLESGETVCPKIGEADKLLKRYLWRSCLLSGARRQLQLEQKLVAEYSRFERVQKIHLLDTSGGMSIYIWLDQVRYDDELMDRLLDREWSLLQRFQDVPFEVFYLPMPEDGAQFPIPDRARLVFD